MAKIIKMSISSIDESVIADNKERMDVKFGKTSNRLPWQKEFEAFWLVGPGAEQLFRLFGGNPSNETDPANAIAEEAINDLTAHAADGTSLMETFDEMRKYSQTRVCLSAEDALTGVVVDKKFRFVKIANETSERGEVYIPYLYDDED